MVDPVSAAVDGSQVFDPFGQVAGAAGVSSPLGFQSDVTDAVTGDVWMGARWMAPSLGVFTSRDTYAGAVATPATLNRYAYANGNPMSNWDPTGHSADELGSAVGTALVSITSSVGNDGRELLGGVNQVLAQAEARQREVGEARGDVRYASGRSLFAQSVDLIVAVTPPPSGFMHELNEVGRGFTDTFVGMGRLVKGVAMDYFNCNKKSLKSVLKGEFFGKAPAECDAPTLRAALKQTWHSITHPWETLEACFDNPSYCLGQQIASALISKGLQFAAAGATRALSTETRALTRTAEFGDGTPSFATEQLESRAVTRHLAEPEPPSIPATNPAAEAAGWQGRGAYPGVDAWENVTLAKGTRVHAGEPGVSGFFASDSAAASVGHDATALNQGLQIAPRNGAFRPGLTEFELTSDVTVGRSIASANPQFGPGGLEQFYIPNWQDVTSPIVSRLMK